MDKQTDRIRIGRIDYTNVWPIYYYFDLQELGSRVEMTVQVPTGLNRAMAEGSIDMGPISSFAYGENAASYLLVPDLSVSSFGEVNSILLFHRKPLSEVARGTVALPTTSATSVNLLKIILERFYGGRPQYRDAAPNLVEMMASSDAALLIGDDAIRAQAVRPDYLITDLGEVWREWTGKWMSFAVWAVRRETADRLPEHVSQVFAAFRRSKRKGLLEPYGMIEDATRQVGETPEYWQRYFSSLSYDFGPEQQEGLTLYFRYAYELGLLERMPEIRLWTDNSVIQVNE